MLALLAYILLFLVFYIEQRRKNSGGRTIAMTSYIFALRIISLLMVFSTGSRTSILSLAVYILAYFLLNLYRKNAATANALLIVTFSLLVLFIVAAFDVFFLVRQSGRIGNFTPLLNMTADELITGFGFTNYTNPESFYSIGERLGFSYMDSMYAMVILRSGITGFCLFFVPLIASIVMFFRSIRSMTKFQMAIGALLVQSMFYFLAEKTLYEFSYFGLLTWTLYIVVANERSITQKSSSLTPKHYPHTP